MEEIEQNQDSTNTERIAIRQEITAKPGGRNQPANARTIAWCVLIVIIGVAICLGALWHAQAQEEAAQKAAALKAHQEELAKLELQNAILDEIGKARYGAKWQGCSANRKKIASQPAAADPARSTAAKN
jgi:hypothetical protein